MNAHTQIIRYLFSHSRLGAAPTGAGNLLIPTPPVLLYATPYFFYSQVSSFFCKKLS